MSKCSRRALLRTGAGAVAGGAALTAASPASAAPSFGGWLDSTSNYDGVVDKTGQSEVTIEVGVKANNGNFGFGPAAVRVDPGTKVVWKWVNGNHNVVAKDGSFKSKLSSEQGFTFSQTFDSTGVVKYYCQPHKMMGMKGVVVVGDAAGGAGSSGSGKAEQSDSSGPRSFDGWLQNTSNYDGVADKTGQSEVTIEVGVKANNGNFGFGPAAVKVDPGTKVTWKWVAGSHNVVAKDDSFKSKLSSEKGFTFSQTFDSPGVTKYYCQPHKMMGMKGVVVVGEGGSSSGGGDANPSGMSADDWAAVGFGLSLVAGLLSPLAFAAFIDDDGHRQ